MQDILPADQAVYQYCIEQFNQLAAAAGFKPIETPLVEPAELFSRTVGEGSEVVSKEMYTFEDRGGNLLALRPEMTAGVGRAYLEHGMASWPQPVKLYYSGPAFRYDRPQEGRQRQFTQVGVEAIGEAQPSIDAQVIFLAQRYYRRLGLNKLTLQVNSIGDAKCRPQYLKDLTAYLKQQAGSLCEAHQANYERNPLRVLDCKKDACQAVAKSAPQILNALCAECQEHFRGVLEYLDQLELSYELNSNLVRGLDYYTRTVFEFFGQRSGSQSSLGAGGRYDGLIAELGGSSTPAVGFSLGVERIMLELDKSQLPVGEAKPQVFVATLGEPARLSAFTLVEQLLDAGVASVGSIDKKGIQTQLSRANKLGVPYAVIIGQKEVYDGTVMLRDMISGTQEVLPAKRAVEELSNRLLSKPD
jgi:histidyl-tRNA synthetase